MPIEPSANGRAAELGAAAPSVLEKLIGQRTVVEQIRVGLEAAWADAQRFPHALLVGPPGLGKSSFCSIVAREIGSELREALGQSIVSPSDLNNILLTAEDRDVVLIDEAHELTPEFQTALYRAVEERKLFVSGDGFHEKLRSIPLADFTLLLATTDEFRLLQPLRDRMKMTLRFGFYDIDEIEAILRQRTAALGWEVERSVMRSVAERGRGTPRLALRLLESVRRVCRAQGEVALSRDHLNRACELEQLDRLGLDISEQRYLRVLSETREPVRLNVIASRLGLPPATVSRVVESFLIREGLVIKGDGGRQLSAKGRAYLSGDGGDGVGTGGGTCPT